MQLGHKSCFMPITPYHRNIYSTCMGTWSVLILSGILCCCAIIVLNLICDQCESWHGIGMLMLCHNTSLDFHCCLQCRHYCHEAWSWHESQENHKISKNCNLSPFNRRLCSLKTLSATGLHEMLFWSDQHLKHLFTCYQYIMQSWINLPAIFCSISFSVCTFC